MADEHRAPAMASNAASKSETLCSFALAVIIQLIGRADVSYAVAFSFEIVLHLAHCISLAEVTEEPDCRSVARFSFESANLARCIV